MKYLFIAITLLFSASAFGQAGMMKRLRPLAAGEDYVIVSDTNGVWWSVTSAAFLGTFIDYASVDDSTDASGEIVIAHDHGDSLFSLQVTVTDTFTNVPVPVIVSKSPTTFTLRFYSAKDGALFDSDAIRFDWLLLGL